MLTLTAVVPPEAGPGHGECFLWKRNDEASISVDAGGAFGVGVEAAKANPRILVLSHDDKDHIGGAASLIKAAASTLEELWVPAEWAILIKQLAETTARDPLSQDDVADSPDAVAQLIATQLFNAQDTSDGLSDGQALLAEYLVGASRTLERFAAANTASPEDDLLRRGWYGARSLKEIVDRVLLSGKRLVKILKEAIGQSVKIRFFSIDLALHPGAKDCWTTSGYPGTVTLANASECPYWQAVRIPPGIFYAYALCRLTIQNRRALSTLLWGESERVTHSVIIWSDSDGEWLNTLNQRGFCFVTKTLLASSAPHHASGNVAHARVWTELRSAPSRAVMISAGGQKGQSYPNEYVALGNRRACTWCRHGSNTYQQVVARGGCTGMTLLTKCLAPH